MSGPLFYSFCSTVQPTITHSKRASSRWELPERIEDPEAYEVARAESLIKMRPARRPG